MRGELERERKWDDAPTGREPRERERERGRERERKEGEKSLLNHLCFPELWSHIPFPPLAQTYAP